MPGADGSSDAARSADFRRRTLAAAFAGAVLVVSGCTAQRGLQPVSAVSALPEHARPRSSTIAAASVDLASAFGYRALTRGDFRAAQPPPEVAAHAESMGAWTCALIAPPSATRFRLLPAAGGRFVAFVEGAVFRALFEPECSWWNQQAGGDPHYVLEHEQVHFALVELQARELTRRFAALRIEVATPAEARDAFEQRYRELYDETGRALIEVNARFDAETSVRRDIGRQAEWLRWTAVELARTAP